MLILLRHGQAHANVAGALLGREDQPLTELGRRQAGAAADVLREARRVVSSPLTRALSTATLLGLPVTVDDRWIELDYGEFEGRRPDELPPGVWARWRGDVHFVPPGGEPLAAVGGRVRAACEELATEAAEGDVVVVSHVSPIKAAVAWALGVGDEVAWRLHLSVAAICRIEVGARGRALASFNEVAHLERVASTP